MTINLRDTLRFLFDSGRGLSPNQVKWSEPDPDLATLIKSHPIGSSARTAARWNSTDAIWEAYSSEDTWYYALTASTNKDLVSAGIEDMLVNGQNSRVRGAQHTHYNPSVAEAVISRYNTPYYFMYGQANSWAADGDTDAVAAFATSPIYSWLILPQDLSIGSIRNSLWTIAPRSGSTFEPEGVFANIPSYSRISSDLHINSVAFVVARARIEWEVGTVNHNFGLAYTPIMDVVTLEWVTP